MAFSRANSGGWSPGNKLTATQINTIDANQSNGIDKRSGALEIDTRTALQRQSIVSAIESGSWSLGEFAHQNTAIGGTAASLIFPLRLPHGSTITAIQCWYDAGGGHAALPSIMPKIELRECTLSTDTRNTVGSQSDTSASVAAFEARHTITLSGLSYTVDNSTKAIVALVTAEFGSNALQDALVASSILVTFNVSRLDEG